MKRLSSAIILILCLVLCALAFASCDKGGKKTGTTASTTAGETECVHTWETRVERAATCSKEGSQSDFCTKCGAKKPDSTVSIPTIAHTPAEDYTVDAKPTCKEDGYKSKHCTKCDAIIANTIVTIPKDENAHVVADDGWTVTVEPTLTTIGERQGTCTECEKTVTEAYALPVYKSAELDGPYASGGKILIQKTIGEISGENKTFHPSSADADGNDLWFEYSFLWNDTLLNWNQSKSEMSLAGFKNDAGSYRHFYYLYTNDGQSGDCPYAGHFDYSTYLGGLGWECAVDPGNGQPRYKAGWDSPLTRASSPYIYDAESQTTGGWHRIGVRIHQEIKIDNDKGGVVYEGYSELYVDGVKVWKVLLDMQGNWDSTKSEWKQQNGYGGKGKADLKANDLLLWYAKTELEEDDVAEEWTLYNGVYYKDHDDLSVYSSMDNFANSTQTAYAQFYDVIWTCGDGFVRNVTPIATPAARNVTLDDMGTPEDTSDDVIVSGAIFYQ